MEARGTNKMPDFRALLFKGLWGRRKGDCPLEDKECSVVDN